MAAIWQKTRFHPNVEVLETRCTPSVTITPSGGSVLRFRSNQAGDKVVIEQVGTSLNRVRVKVNGSDRGPFSAERIVFIGNGGNDSFTNNSPVAATASGGAGNDVLVGGTSRDVLIGDGGIDFLDGGRDGVSDTLTGGDNGDTFVTHATFVLVSNEFFVTDFNAGQGDLLA